MRSALAYSPLANPSSSRASRGVHRSMGWDCAECPRTCPGFRPGRGGRGQTRPCRLRRRAPEMCWRHGRRSTVTVDALLGDLLECKGQKDALTIGMDADTSCLPAGRAFCHTAAAAPPPPSPPVLAANALPAGAPATASPAGALPAAGVALTGGDAVFATAPAPWVSASRRRWSRALKAPSQRARASSVGAQKR